MAMVVNLAVGMAEQGHQVDVVSLDRRTGSDHEAMWIAELESHGVRTIFLDRRAGAPGMLAAGRLWSLIRRHRYDVLHSHLPMPDAIAGFVRRLSPLRFAHIMTVHNKREPRSYLMTRLAAGASVVYCSEAAREANEDAIAPGTVIPNGIVRNRYSGTTASPVETRQGLGVSPDAVLIMIIGRLCPQKNQIAAIDALALLAGKLGGRKAHLLLCGDGPDRSALENRAHQLHLDDTVHFLGRRTDIPQLLRAADAFVSTSIYEGMPLTVLEAMESGLPCALSAIKEHDEIAADVPGCLFASTSAPADVAQALLTALRTPQTKEDLANARGELLQAYSIERCIESYLAVYRSLSSTRGDALHRPTTAIRQS
jgi:glycosyltransferase involved in cell wall biosynthesis